MSGTTLVAATRQALRAASATTTPAGRLALKLAARIDLDEDETGNSLAALARAYRQALADAVGDQDTAQEANPFDELARKRIRASL